MGTKVNSNYESLITFTRASAGHALRPVSYGSELVANGDFATDSVWNKGTGWSISGGVGSHVGPTGGQIVQDVSTTVGAIYLISYEITATDATVSLRWDGSAFNYPTAAGTYTFVKVATASSTEIGVYASTVTSIDNISVKEVIFDESDGTLTLFEHPDNIPRVEYDADGNRLGLLVEEARTNLQTYSEDFNDSSWTKSGTSVSAATNITAPDGTNNAFKLIESSATEVHRVQGAQAAGGTTSTISCFMKKAERSWGNINFAGFTNGQAWFDLENGVLGTVQSAITASIEDYGNGWYRCSVTGTLTAAATTDIKVANADNAVSYAGDGTSGIYVFGAQTEEGAFPTSYIKSNSGSTTTRSADVASIPVADFGFNADAGSVVAQYTPIKVTSDINAVFEVSSGSTADRAYHSASPSNHWVVRSGNSLSANIDIGTVLEGANKVSATYNKDDFAVSVNGASVSTDTTGNVPTSIIEINIGNLYNGYYLNGHIKSIQYYPRRLTNAQLQALTEPRSTPTLSLTFDGQESSYKENYIHG